MAHGHYELTPCWSSLPATEAVGRFGHGGLQASGKRAAHVFLHDAATRRTDDVAFAPVELGFVFVVLEAKGAEAVLLVVTPWPSKWTTW